MTVMHTQTPTHTHTYCQQCRLTEGEKHKHDTVEMSVQIFSQAAAGKPQTKLQKALKLNWTAVLYSLFYNLMMLVESWSPRTDHSSTLFFYWIIDCILWDFGGHCLFYCLFVCLLRSLRFLFKITFLWYLIFLIFFSRGLIWCNYRWHYRIWYFFFYLKKKKKPLSSY